MESYVMIEIDGSYGEGGGALLRLSAALAASTGQSIKVSDIRAKRPRKGLMPQHLNALKSVALLSNASYNGLHDESTEVLFRPHELVGGDYKLDIGTAGSITLVLQCFMIPAVFSDGPVNLMVKGGTDVRWSPMFDYFNNVTIPLLKSIGYHIDLQLVQRGHYPKGGGIVNIQIHPINKFKPFKLVDLRIDRIKGISHAVMLPEHVASRQARSAEKFLEKEGFDADIEIQHSNQALGPGSGIVLWTEGKNRIGGSSIGEPGKRAEIVGQEAAKELLYHISGDVALDRYMGDQIIPYMSLAGSSHVKTAELTQHTVTNIYISERITGKSFKVEGKLGDQADIMVD